jgi:hypothetical protein
MYYFLENVSKYKINVAYKCWKLNINKETEVIRVDTFKIPLLYVKANKCSTFINDIGVF